MKNKIITALIIISYTACLLNADSIWAKRDQSKTDLYADAKARHIGDVLTVLIAEESKVDNKSNRNMNKDTSRSVNFNGQLGIVEKTPSGEVVGNYLPRMPGMTMAAASTNKFDSKADYKDERSFEDAITVVVIDVMPNNNLVVLGTRTREIAGDKQVIEVSGIVRPTDITYGNTIKSQQIANFAIVTKNTGYAAAFNRPGWLGRFFDIVWPF